VLTLMFLWFRIARRCNFKTVSLIIIVLICTLVEDHMEDVDVIATRLLANLEETSDMQKNDQVLRVFLYRVKSDQSETVRLRQNLPTLT